MRSAHLQSGAAIAIFAVLLGLFTPLTGGHVIVYDPDIRRHKVDWNASTDPALSTVIEYNAPVVYTDPNGEIVEQYGFDAFGNLVRRDEFRLVKSGSQGYYNTFRQRLGHQGLFADRLEGHTNQRVLNTGIDIWYQSRSRWYAPELGRFVTADPNGTGIPVQASLAMLGTIPTGPPSGNFEWEAHYGDGWDTYTAYGANPVMVQDPTGLFVGFFAPMTTMDVYTDYNSEALNAGISSYAQASTLFSNYAEWQSAAFEVAMDMRPRASESLAAMLTIGVLKTERHHIIPKFLYGLDGKSNLLDLPKLEHGVLHELINQEFRNKKLPPPNARGRDNWRFRLINNEVSMQEIDRAKEALRVSAQKFDTRFPDFVSRHGSLLDKMNQRLLEYSTELPKTINRAQRAARRR